MTAPAAAPPAALAPPRRAGRDALLVLLCGGLAAAVPFTGAPPWSVPAVVAVGVALAALLPRPDTALRLALLVVLLPPGLLPATVQSGLEAGTIAVAGVAAGVQPRGRARRPLPVAVWLLGAFLVWSLLTTGWSDDPAAGTDLLRRYALALVLLAAVVVRTPDRQAVDRLLDTLAAAGWVVLACGLWAFVSGARTDDGRLEVLGMNPNQVGNVLLLVTAGVMWRAVGPRGTPARTVQALVFLPCALAIIALTGSRGSLIAYVLLLLMFTGTRTLRRWGTTAAVLGLALLLATPGLFGTVLQRFQEQDPDQLSRGTLWAAGAELIADHPLGTGVGRGSYVMPAYIDARVAQDHFQDRDEYPAHNPFIEVGTDSGLVGVLLFGAAVVAAALTAASSAARALRRRDRTGLVYGAVVGTSTVAFVTVWLKSGGESYSFTTFVLLALWLVADRAAGDRTGA